MTGDRRDCLAAMTREILGHEKGAAVSERRNHIPGDRPFVEDARSRGGDGRERAPQRRELHHVAFRRRAPPEQEMLRRAGVGAQLAGRSGPVPGNARGDRKPAFGVADRRRQRAGQIEAAMRLEDRGPGIDRTRHGDGVDRRRLDPAHALRVQRLDRRARTGAPAAVVGPDRLIGPRQHAEAIAADPRHMRLDHAKHCHRRHCRIRGIAAGMQGLDRGEARQGVRGRSHSLAGDHRRPTGQLKVSAHWAITRAGELRAGETVHTANCDLVPGEINRMISSEKACNLSGTCCSR